MGWSYVIRNRLIIQNLGTMSTNKEIIKRFRKLFKKNSDPEKKKNYERYFKHVVECHGIASKDHKNLVFNPVWKDTIKSMKLKKQLSISYEILESNNLDEKKLGVMIMNRVVKKIFKEGEEFLETFFTKMEELIDEHVYDWATADTLASQVFAELLRCEENDEEESEFVCDRIEGWKDAVKEGDGEDEDEDDDEPNYSSWRQRIACVTFVKFARHGNYDDVVISICTTCLNNRYRFTQLGVGWVLRELSLADLDRVVEFIKEKYDYFIREGLRYAIEKMDKDLRKELLDYKKKTGKKRKSRSKKKKKIDEFVEEEEEEEEDEEEEKRESKRRKLDD